MIIIFVAFSSERLDPAWLLILGSLQSVHLPYVLQATEYCIRIEDLIHVPIRERVFTWSTSKSAELALMALF